MNQSLGLVSIVDDNPGVRKQLGEALELAGYEVRSYSDAEAFLENALDVIPSVIVVDMRMPKMTGLELLKTLRNRDFRAPVVFISGESHSQEIIDAMKNGVVDFVLKPFDIGNLLNSIRRAMALDEIRLSEAISNQKARRSVNSLLPLEKEVLKLCAKSFRLEDIAFRLNMPLEKAFQVHRDLSAKLSIDKNSDMKEIVDRAFIDAL